MSQTNMRSAKNKKVITQVIAPIYESQDPWYRKPYKNPNLLSTQIRIDNNVPATYVLKRFKDGTYKYFTYQQNQATGCYTLVGVQKGNCVSTIINFN